MSPYGRWRCSKIVEPVSRAQEISGGLKNALDRGEPLEKAKQSFINAGYTPEEVNTAAQMIGSLPSTQTASSVQTTQTTPTTQPAPTQPQTASVQPQTTTAKPATKTSSKKLIIILSIVSAVILIASLVLGLFWDKIF